MSKLISSIQNNKWIILILLVATVLRLYNIDYQSLWMDEIYTMNISSPNNSFSTVIEEVNNRDGFPYLYFFTLKILHTFFGHTAVIARLLSVIGAIASIFLIYKTSKKLISKESGLIAAFLITINEYHLYISQDARSYSLYLAATIWVYYRMILFLENKNLKNAIYYGLAAGLLLNINFFGFINLFCQFVFIVYYFLESKTKLDKNNIKNLLIIALISIILFLPNIQKFLLLFGKGEFWVPKPTEESFTIMLREVLSISEFTLFIYIPIFYFLLISLFKKPSGLINNKNNLSFTFLFFWIIGFILFMLVKSYGDVSLILTRYFTSIIPVIFIILAWGISIIKNRTIKTLLISFIFIFSFIQLVFVKKYYTSPNKAQFREASNFVIENHKNNEKIYTSQKYWFDYYFKNDNKTINIDEIELEGLIQEMKADSTKIIPFWYIDAFGKTFSPSEETNNFISQNFHIENNYDGFQAWTKHFVLLKDVPKIIDLSKYNLSNQYNGDMVMFNIETFETLENNIKTSGWAYFDKQNATKTTVDLVLIKEGSSKGLRLQSQKVNRPDVTTYFKNQFNVDNAGFNSTINTANLEAGNYKLAIYLKNEETKKEGLVLTDKTINK